VGGGHYSHAFPCCRSRCNMCWRTGRWKADLRLVLACMPWMPDSFYWSLPVWRLVCSI